MFVFSRILVLYTFVDIFIHNRYIYLLYIYHCETIITIGYKVRDLTAALHWGRSLSKRAIDLIARRNTFNALSNNQIS